ncbi:MAG: zinc-dependent peptidase [Proteobacteria bacterium]|nr:zinc-dependent peptidase [Pseudomonadota bacterium]
MTRWRRARVLARSALPDALWHEAFAALPFLAYLHDDERARLRDLVVLFLEAKSIVGAGGHEVTPRQRVIIALQACLLLLNRDLALYDGFENVIVYPGEFRPVRQWEDEDGVVHESDEPLAGEAMPNGPVVLSWPDVEAGADFEASGMNLVIHEFAHKLDMVKGEADGCPPLPPGMSTATWQRVFTTAYAHFCGRVDRGRRTVIDAYAAEHPAEFFAVLSEVFFADPVLLSGQYPAVYAQLAQFYAQDPASRIGAPRVAASRDVAGSDAGAGG